MPDPKSFPFGHDIASTRSYETVDYVQILGLDPAELASLPSYDAYVEVLTKANRETRLSARYDFERRMLRLNGTTFEHGVPNHYRTEWALAVKLANQAFTVLEDRDLSRACVRESFSQETMSVAFASTFKPIPRRPPGQNPATPPLDVELEPFEPDAAFLLEKAHSPTPGEQMRRNIERLQHRSSARSSGRTRTALVSPNSDDVSQTFDLGAVTSGSLGSGRPDRVEMDNTPETRDNTDGQGLL